jgi:xylan 1,4-beta-xylosidase
LRGDYVDCSSTGRLDLDDILSNGVRSAPDIDVVATRDDKGISILCWNYHDDDVAGPDGRISLEIAGVPQGYRAWHFRVDGQHSNAYNAWQQMGEPQQIDGAGLKKLQEAAGLAELETPKFEYRDGVLVGELVLPRRGVSAIRLEF